MADKSSAEMARIAAKFLTVEQIDDGESPGPSRRLESLFARNNK